MSESEGDRPSGPSTPPPLTDEEATRRARRALLRAGLFAPAVLATLTLSADAQAQAANCSCNPPPNCSPMECKPRGGLC